MTFYSRELRKLTLFYLAKPRDRVKLESLYSVLKKKKPIYIRAPGVVLSSLRPIYVLLRRSVYDKLEKSKAYVVSRATSNASLCINDVSDVISVDNARRLAEITGKPTPLPIRLLYMIRDRERKIEEVEPQGVVELIKNRKQVIVRTVWSQLIDLLCYNKNVPDDKDPQLLLMIVSQRDVKLWHIPWLSPRTYLGIDAMRERLHIPEQLLNRIVIYDPTTNTVLIVQPLQSIKLSDIRKIIYGRPQLPLTPMEFEQILIAQLREGFSSLFNEE